VRDGVIDVVAYTQTKVFEAAINFARTEGIIPAPESAHAIRAAMDEARACKETGETTVVTARARASCSTSTLQSPIRATLPSVGRVDHRCDRLLNGDLGVDRVELEEVDGLCAQQGQAAFAVGPDGLRPAVRDPDAGTGALQDPRHGPCR
jgi:hypothetical protein